jgi:hypothetical protein
MTIADEDRIRSTLARLRTLTGSDGTSAIAGVARFETAARKAPAINGLLTVSQDRKQIFVVAEKESA